MNERRKKLDKDYADLFVKLSLSDKNREILKDLLVEWEFAASNAWLDPRFSSENRPSYDEVRSVIDENKDTVNKDMRSLLGDDNYFTLAYYIETLGERRASEAITARFNYEAEPIKGNVRDAFIDVLYNANKAFANSEIPSADRLARLNFLKEKILEGSKTILSPAQLISVQNYYKDAIQKAETIKKEQRQTW
jgi:hypothetical protein